MEVALLVWIWWVMRKVMSRVVLLRLLVRWSVQHQNPSITKTGTQQEHQPWGTDSKVWSDRKSLRDIVSWLFLYTWRLWLSPSTYLQPISWCVMVSGKKLIQKIILKSKNVDFCGSFIGKIGEWSYIAYHTLKCLKNHPYIQLFLWITAPCNNF